MSNETQAAKSAPTKPAPAKVVPRALDETDAVVVQRLLFRESVDVPGEQGIRSIGTHDRMGKPRYQILWLPRVNVYLVRAWELRPASDARPTHTFTIPCLWAIAELEVV